MTDFQTSILVFIGVGIFAGFVMAHAQAILRRRKSSFLLYKTRDDLVMLVAQGVLSEESPVFQHYYKRINFILREAPKVGFDDILDAVIKHRKSDDFDKNMKDAEDIAEKMSIAVEEEVVEVKRIIASFYFAQKQMLLSHSSLIRFTYIAFVKGWFPEKMRSTFGVRVSHGIQYVEFVDKKANQFQMSAATVKS